jgi:methenyltetrahydrofolate cyclohydrolase
MDSFLLELARAQPDPGGGAAAAFGAKLGLALLEKVVQLESQRRAKPRRAASLTWEEALARLRGLAEKLHRLQGDDVQSYFKLKEARASRDAAALAAAVREAVSCPGEIMRQAGEALKLLAWTGGHCQRHLVSDLLVAGEFLTAALRGAYHIAAANLTLVSEEEECLTLRRQLGQACRTGEDFYNQAKAAMVARENGFDRCRG